MKIKIGQINFSLIFLFTIINAISLTILKSPLKDYLIYGITFFIYIILFLIAKKKVGEYKSNALIFITVGIITTLLGEHGNTTGVIFLCFSLYIYNSDKWNIFLIIITTLTIIIKYLLLNMTVLQTLNIFILYSYIIIIYYILIHPKKPELINNPKIDDETRKVLQYLTLGYKIKEIAKLGNIYLSEDAIRQRLLRTRKEFMCTTNVQLTYELFKLGYFKHKSD